MQSWKINVKLHQINYQPFWRHNRNNSLIFVGPKETVCSCFFLGLLFSRKKTAFSCHKSCCTQLSDPLCPWPTVILNAVSQRKMWTTSILCWTEFSGVLTSRAGDPSGVAFQPASMSLILPNVSISHTKEPILENAVNVSPWYSSINGDQQWQKYLTLLVINMVTQNGMKGKLPLKLIVLSWLSSVFTL